MSGHLVTLNIDSVATLAAMFSYYHIYISLTLPTSSSSIANTVLRICTHFPAPATFVEILNRVYSPIQRAASKTHTMAEDLELNSCRLCLTVTADQMAIMCFGHAVYEANNIKYPVAEVLNQHFWFNVSWSALL